MMYNTSVGCTGYVDNSFSNSAFLISILVVLLHNLFAVYGFYRFSKLLHIKIDRYLMLRGEQDG